MEERNCYVYEDYRMDNWTCCYVGMGSKNEERGYNRFEIAERNDHHDNIMDGCGIARVIIRDNLTRSEANVLEEARIYYYVFVLGYTIDIKGYIKGGKNDSHLTNQTWGGDGTKGCNPFENKTEEEMKEIRRKIGEANKGRNPLANKTEKEMREIGRKHSEACKGEKHPMYGVHRYGEESPFYGKHHSEETCEKLKQIMKGRYTGEKSPMARKVRCLETGEIFNALTEAVEWCGLKSKASITLCCQGKRKSAGKHPITGEKLHWEYVD